MVEERHIQMKFSIDKKTFGIGIVALSVIILGVSFIYLLFNGSLFFTAFGKILDVFMPVFYGFIIAYLLSSIVNFIEEKCMLPLLKRFKVNITSKLMSRMRLISITIALILAFLCIYAFLLIVVPEIYKSLQSIVVSFPVYINNLIDFAELILARYPEIEQYFMNIMNEYSSDIYEWVSSLLPSMNAFIKSLSQSVISFILTLWDLVLGLIVAIYMLASKERFIGQCKKMLFSAFKTERANGVLKDIRFIDRTFGGFISGKLLDSLIIGILCFICLQIIGTPYPLLISFIVGVTNIIPFFGPFIGAIPSAFLVLMVDPLECLYFLIFIFLLQQFDGNYLGPKILGDSTGLSGFWVLFSITIFGGLFGFVGMIIGVPTVAVIYELIKRFMNRQLTKKGYPLDTVPYINVKEITTNSQFIMMDEKDEFYRISKETVGVNYNQYNVIRTANIENNENISTGK